LEETLMKRNRWNKLMSLLLLGLLVSAVAIAAPKVNPKKGKVFYRANCRVCHDGTTEAADLSPNSKTMEQWGREFEDGAVVKKSCVARVKEKVGTELTEQDLLDIQAYLVQHAADSDQPASCGN